MELKGDVFSSEKTSGLQLIVVRQKLNVVRDFSTNISQLSEILTTPPWLRLPLPWSENSGLKFLTTLNF